MSYANFIFIYCKIIVVFFLFLFVKKCTYLKERNGDFSFIFQLEALRKRTKFNFFALGIEPGTFSMANKRVFLALFVTLLNVRVQLFRSGL